eukprot:CAMPEP_0118962898 /NCGR_PEP_ID=MMETSP1173-20130426/1056_1 /TAXON_ID=1034831 /ORGANISM="Rhizochromulina marina cf, Strain CCMP1243" /LENGTH=199 /DNA_ID=CAMNT_0006911207 /DNA_START=239 /DNA_END=838 /DNA_ORIENTATION=-
MAEAVSQWQRIPNAGALFPDSSTLPVCSQGKRRRRASPGGDEAVSTPAIDVLAQRMIDTASLVSKAELEQFIQTGRSNRRPLQWVRFKIEAGTKFSFHAHPNIEVMYVVDGALLESRWRGPIQFRGPYSRGGRALGPDLSSAAQADFFDRRFSAGSIIFNEIGSVHRSFCSETEGCELFGFWGGCHARIPSEFQPPPAL